MAKVNYETELKFAKANWDRVYSSALNGNLDKNALYGAMTSLQAIHGKKLYEEIENLERSWVMARESKEDKYKKKRRELKEYCQNYLRQHSESTISKET